MQRLAPRGFAAALSILALSLAPACKGDQADGGKSADKQPEPAASGEGEVAPSEPGEGGPSQGEAGQPQPEAGEVAAGEAGAAEAGAAEAGSPEQPAVDVVPGLFEQAKNLDTDDDAAKKALADAIAAGGPKIDAAKIAYERGDKLMADGEAERAAIFYQWAADTHKLYAEPVYKLATLAAYAGDLEIAKEHLAELQKRGNKKLMKKVGVDPAFAPLHDDPDVRKIYEQ
ncbi:MAG TPA: hypothetical protein VK034_11720 [Enhygromyxa sp.]|nr:hypothetical protein [Enhygromyxa sp.]